MLVVVAPAGADDATCDDGVVDGTTIAADADGDGMVCVDRDDGDVHEDRGQWGTIPGERDRNQDFIVCGKQVGNGGVITVDNNAPNPENANCPPAFLPIAIT
jgi:hypothetical protein